MNSNLSFTAFSEGPYTTVLLSAVYAVVRALNHSSVRQWLLVGGAFGLAYLLRAEAVAALLIATLFALVATMGRPAVRWKCAAAAIAGFLVLALPQMIFISRATGEVRLEAKSAIFFAVGSRLLAAKTSLEVDHQLPDGQHDNEPSDAPNLRFSDFGSAASKWAHWAIDAHLMGTGIFMRSNAEVIRETRTSLKESLPLVVESVRLNAPEFLNVLTTKWLGAPFLPALALLGALRRPWRRPQASSRLFVLLVAVAPVVATFSALWNQPRYYFVLLPFLLIWASNGLVEVGLWMKASSAAAGWRVLAGRVSECIILGLIGLAIIITPLKGVGKLWLFTEGSPSTRVEKDVGLWIGHQQNRPVRIMDVSLVLAYHAGAQWVHFPYCTPELALRFLDAAQVDYVVLRRGAKVTQYYEDWLTQGIPDPRAELLHEPSAADTGQFMVFRWHRGG
jgi:Dolichyl-phosphate-mannose-protein mannosyltransferase